MAVFTSSMTLAIPSYVTIQRRRVREAEEDAEKHARDRVRNRSGRYLEGRIAHQVGQTLRRVLDLHLVARAESRPPILRDSATRITRFRNPLESADHEAEPWRI